MEEAISLLIRFRFNWWFIICLLNIQELPETRISMISVVVVVVMVMMNKGEREERANTDYLPRALNMC